MLFYIYSALLYLFSVLFFPYMAVKMALKGKSRAGIRQRLGLFEEGFFSRRGDRTLWIHAVSVGETLAAMPIVEELKARHRGLKVFFSTVTETGNAVAREKLSFDDGVFYFPFDFPWVVKRVVGEVRPDCFVLMETEIWPNLIRALYDGGVPSLVVNGRISPRSFRGYRRARFFMKRVLMMLSHLNMQTYPDAQRIKALGAPAGNVSVVGNVKFDQAAKLLNGSGKKLITRAGLGIPEDALVLIAGSTHEGEEAEVLAAYRRILESYPEAFVIIAPRHPERLAAVRSLLKDEGFSYRLRSSLTGEPMQGPGAIVLDTMGELASLYRVGDINFVGGSWSETGGHNILEPAAFGKPVFFGPNMHNFAEISEILKDCGVGIEVKDGLDLARESMKLVREPERMETLGKVAKETLLGNRGALERDVELIERCLYG